MLSRLQAKEGNVRIGKEREETDLGGEGEAVKPRRRDVWGGVLWVLRLKLKGGMDLFLEMDEAGYCGLKPREGEFGASYRGD